MTLADSFIFTLLVDLWLYHYLKDIFPIIFHQNVVHRSATMEKITPPLFYLEALQFMGEKDCFHNVMILVSHGVFIWVLNRGQKSNT